MVDYTCQLFKAPLVREPKSRPQKPFSCSMSCMQLLPAYGWVVACTCPRRPSIDVYKPCMRVCAPARIASRPRCLSLVSVCRMFWRWHATCRWSASMHHHATSVGSDHRMAHKLHAYTETFSALATAFSFTSRRQKQSVTQQWRRVTLNKKDFRSRLIFYIPEDGYYK